LPFSAAFVDFRGSLIGWLRFGLQAKQSGDDGKAQGISANSGMTVGRAFGGRKCVGQAPDDGVFGVPGRRSVPHAFNTVGVVSNSQTSVAIFPPRGFSAQASGVQYCVALGKTALTGPLRRNREHNVEMLKSERPAGWRPLVNRRAIYRVPALAS